MNSELVVDVEQFLYREARLLDERRFEEWVDLFAEDAVYEMPTRHVPDPADQALRPVDEELASPDELYLFDEPRFMLEARVLKLRTGKAWAEEPPSRTRRLITNIEVSTGPQSEELVARSNFVLYRSRGDGDRNWLVGSRRDLLRRSGDSFLIARRRAILDDTVVPAPNLAVFF
jgi:3-phenylpropionate/cinnamic acid dioxygenase small subunit